MGAPIIIGTNSELWISNGMKDAFCEVVTAVATLEGRDITAIYREAAGVAGTYGVTGLDIDLDEFHPYLGGREGVRHHLDVCRARLADVADSCGLTPQGAERMAHLLAWAAHIMDGLPIPEGSNFYEDWPPATRN